MQAIYEALRDLKGKHFGEPIHRLLGGKRQEGFPAYAPSRFRKDGRRACAIAPA